MREYWQNFIGGSWVDGAASERIVTEDPATARPLAEVSRGTPADADRAVAAARECVLARSLTALRPADRGRMISDIARYLREHAGEIARVISLDSGKNLTQARWEVEGSARYFEYYGGLADKIEGSYVPLGAAYANYVIPVPYGVSVQIIPWNYPLEMAARSAAPALAAGNAVVIKSPALDPLAVTFLGAAAEEVGLPRGAINIVCGYGHDTGAALAAHSGIDQIVFTGSVETGREILHAAADSVVPAVVELGGKSAGIVLPDADLDKLTEQTRWAIYLNSGQACNAMSRLLVHDSIHDEVMDRLVDMAAGLSIGPGIDDHDHTPVISNAQLEQVDRYARIGKEDGGIAATGGEPVKDLPGHYFQPTVFAEVTNDMTIAQEEIFGPVLAVMRYSDPADAVRIANDSEYGLAAGIFGNDLETATWMADRLQAGQIYVNEWYAGGVETPFGGFKRSGFGREKGQAAIANYYQWKNVGIRRHLE